MSRRAVVLLWIMGSLFALVMVVRQPQPVTGNDLMTCVTKCPPNSSAICTCYAMYMGEAFLYEHQPARFIIGALILLVCTVGAIIEWKQGNEKANTIPVSSDAGTTTPTSTPDVLD